MTRERRHHGGAHVDAAGLLTGESEQGQRIDPGDLCRPEAVEPVVLRIDDLLNLSVDVGCAADGANEYPDFHGFKFSLCFPLPAKS